MPEVDDFILHISNPSENVLPPVTENNPTGTMVEVIPSVAVPSIEKQTPVLSKTKLPSKAIPLKKSEKS